MNERLSADAKGDQCCSSDPAGDSPTNTTYRCGAAVCNDMPSWDVSLVTDMSELFRDKTSFNQPIGGWNMSSVTNMNHMLAAAESFNQPIGAWDVSSVTIMSYALRGPSTFNQPIGGWDVSSVTHMDGMLAYTSFFNQPIGSWDVSSVTKMDYMFYGLPALGYPAFTHDITGWSTPALTTSVQMFDGNSVWQGIYARPLRLAGRGRVHARRLHLPGLRGGVRRPPRRGMRVTASTSPRRRRGPRRPCGTTLNRSSHCAPRAHAPDAWCSPRGATRTRG